MNEEMTDKQFEKILKMISMILDGCKDLDEAKTKVQNPEIFFTESTDCKNKLQKYCQKCKNNKKNLKLSVQNDDKVVK